MLKTCSCRRGNPDVTGFVLNQVGRGVLFNAALFLIGTYLHLANRAAGCPTDVCLVEEDDTEPTPAPSMGTTCGKVWGVRPAALVSFGLTIGQVTIACLMPVVGSIVDHSDHRKRIGLIGLFLAWLITTLQAAVTRHTWQVLLILYYTVYMLGYMINQTCAMVYLPELTDNNDVLASINGRARVKEMSSMLFYMIFVAACQMIFTLDAVDTGRVASLASALVGGLVTFCSWRYFTERPASRVLPEKAHLLLYGFVNIRETVMALYAEAPELLKFLGSYAFSEAGTGGVVGLVAIYLIEQLEMCGYVTVLVCAIVFTVPGAALSSVAARKGRAKQAHAGCLLFLSLVIFAVPWVIYKPSHANGVLPWVFAVLLGLGLGFLYPAQRNVFSVLVPGGMEGRVLGIYNFFGASLSWVPSLLFGATYQGTGSMRLGMALVCVFHAVACVGLVCFVDVERGSADARRTRSKRRGAAFASGVAPAPANDTPSGAADEAAS
jgi:MFS-type transporter involved in bile tolerance (Atg22 family)